MQFTNFDEGEPITLQGCEKIDFTPTPSAFSPAVGPCTRSNHAGGPFITALSSGRSVIRFAGPRVRSALATCCRLDLHPRAFGPGSAAMTRVAHVACGIRLVDATPTFDLIIGSTYARWLIEELLEASAGYGVRFEPAPKPYRSAMQDSGPK